MARAVTIGNGNILVGLDYRGQVRDLYFPYVGQRNHISGASGTHIHRVGVYVDGQLSWLDDPNWQVTVACTKNSLIGELRAENPYLGVRIVSRDAVHNEQNVFLRNFSVFNKSDKKKIMC